MENALGKCLYSIDGELIFERKKASGNDIATIPSRLKREDGRYYLVKALPGDETRVYLRESE